MLKIRNALIGLLIVLAVPRAAWSSEAADQNACLDAALSAHAEISQRLERQRTLPTWTIAQLIDRRRLNESYCGQVTACDPMIAKSRGASAAILAANEFASCLREAESGE